MHHMINYSLSLVSEIGCHFSGKWHGAIWHHAIISTNIVTLLNEPIQARVMRSFSHGTINLSVKMYLKILSGKWTVVVARP